MTLERESFGGNVQAENDSLEDFLVTRLTPEVLARPLLVSFNQWEYAAAALAEICTTFLEIGSQPTLAAWAGRTPMIDVGWETSRIAARLFGSRTIDQRLEAGLRKAGLSEADIAAPPLRHVHPRFSIETPDPLTRASIRGFTYSGTPMGRAIVQIPPSADTPSSDDALWPRPFVERAAASYAYVFDNVTELIRKKKTTLVCVFNGRFLHDRAVAEAARRQGVAVIEYDSGGVLTDFDLTLESTHDFTALQERMLRLYEARLHLDSEILGSRWFLDRIEHQDTSNAVFTDSQRRGKGVDVDSSENCVVFFSSSNDEIAELEIAWEEYFHSQERALLTVARVCREEGKTLVVRTHPHLSRKAPDDLRQWLEVVNRAAPDIHLDHESDVDSYTLMQQAGVVVTYGSTTGVEAAFLGRPVIVMGPSIYGNIGCAIRVTNPEELRSAIMEPRFGSRAAAVALGLMMLVRGFTFRHVVRDSRGRHLLHGELLIEANLLTRHVSHMWRRIVSAWLRRG